MGLLNLGFGTYHGHCAIQKGKIGFFLKTSPRIAQNLNSFAHKFDTVHKWQNTSLKCVSSYRVNKLGEFAEVVNIADM